MMTPRVSRADERQQLILEAASTLITAQGAEAVTMKALAQLNGISRPALYQYFASREHILAELALDAMADLANELDRVAAMDVDATDQLVAWVRGTLNYLISPSHKIVKEISIESLPEDKRGLLKAMHGQFMLTLFSPLSKLTPEDPHAVAGFVYSAVVAAAGRIAEGGDLEIEAATLERFIVAGLSGS